VRRTIDLALVLALALLSTAGDCCPCCPQDYLVATLTASDATTGCPVAGLTVQEGGRQLASDQVFACAVDAGACGGAGNGCVHVRLARGMHTLTVGAPGYAS
jgi:hypothetical protein